MTFLPLYQIEFTNSCRNERSSQQTLSGDQVVKLAVKMTKILCAFAFVTLIVVSAAVDLQCYQCSPVTQECEDNKADVVKCGDVSTSRCSRQVKKDAADVSRALRKCVIVDSAGKVSCPNGYNCYNCNQNLCNSNPIVATTAGPATDSAFATRCVWSTTLAALFAIIYL